MKKPSAVPYLDDNIAEEVPPFSSAIILPEQLPTYSPYPFHLRKLCFAVLQDGIRCTLGMPEFIEGKTPKARSDFLRKAAIEAATWLESDDDIYPFSFRVVCHVIGVDPRKVRAKVQAKLMDVLEAGKPLQRIRRP